MTYSDDIRKIASKDGIMPDFRLLSVYSNFSEDQFYKKYLFYKKQGVFDKAIKIARINKLDKYQNELFFFLIEIAETRAKTKWARDVAKSREDERYLKEIQKLNDFCNEIQTYGGYKKSTKTKDPSIKKISFITDKNLSLTIKSHKLSVVIIDLIKEFYNKNKDQIVSETAKKKNLNPRQYDKQFIISLTPVINYLNKETIKWKSKNKIYDFICEFITILDPDIDISPTKIKDVLKAKRC